MNNTLEEWLTWLLPAQVVAVWQWAGTEGSPESTAELTKESAPMGNKGGARMLMEYDVPMRTLRVQCDTYDKDVMVEVLLSDETPYDVTHCSAFNGGPVTCDKRCLRRLLPLPA